MNFVIVFQSLQIRCLVQDLTRNSKLNAQDLADLLDSFSCLKTFVYELGWETVVAPIELLQVLSVIIFLEICFDSWAIKTLYLAIEQKSSRMFASIHAYCRPYIWCTVTLKRLCRLLTSRIKRPHSEQYQSAC